MRSLLLKEGNDQIAYDDLPDIPPSQCGVSSMGMMFSLNLVDDRGQLVHVVGFDGDRWKPT
jgi:hypothetical protein